MKIPRDISGTDLIKSLRKLGYEFSRQVGSHVRITTNQKGQHHVTVPKHDPIKVGTLNSIISDVSEHFDLSKEETIKILFG